MSKGFQKTHGMSFESIYHIWTNMKNKCYNPKYVGFKNVGEIGIEVCAEWKESFEKFYEDMHKSYFKGAHLTRRDACDHYCMQNCRWTSKIDRVDKRNKMLSFNGETLHVDVWAERLGITSATLMQRIYYKMPKEKMFKELIYAQPKKVGERFGKWVIIAHLKGKRDADGKLIPASCMVKCDCGTSKTIVYHSLKSGYSKSCGCLRYAKKEIKYPATVTWLL